jgi:hypothetical protein
MRAELLRVVAPVAVGGLIALTGTAGASVAEHCGSVSYTVPHTDDHGHRALNNLTAVNVSCAAARSVARTFLIRLKAPEHWHATSKVVVVHGNTVGEEIFTRGRARVIGDQDN